MNNKIESRGGVQETALPSNQNWKLKATNQFAVHLASISICPVNTSYVKVRVEGEAETKLIHTQLRNFGAVSDENEPEFTTGGICDENGNWTYGTCGEFFISKNNLIDGLVSIECVCEDKLEPDNKIRETARRLFEVPVRYVSVASRNEFRREEGLMAGIGSPRIKKGILKMSV